MKPYHLQIDIDRAAQIVHAQWFAQSSVRAEGSRDWPLVANALAAGLPDHFLIDLAPLLAEVQEGLIADEAALQRADEFLLLAELLSVADFAELCSLLFLFLWRETQGGALEGTSRGAETVEVDPDHRLVRVWFATNRQPVAGSQGVQGFDERESANQLSYGLCHVFIPKSHKPGSTGTPWWRRWIRLETADDHLELRDTQVMAGDAFWNKFAETMQQWWQPGERNAFVLIHGFNVSFGEAAIRAAQIGYDLKLPGEMAFYSWPSRGATADYSADEATITASYPYIAQFLHEFCQRSQAERIHIFAHSMGNRGFLNALERVIADGNPRLRLGQVFFCAPDEDVRTFTDKVTHFPHECENRTMLVSPQDKAVALSRWLHQYQRAGIAPPITTLPGIETIEVRGFGLLDLGHGYFASAKAVMDDISEAIATQKRASERQIPQAMGNYFAIEV